MIQLGSEILDLTPILTWVLLLTRFAGLFFALPGIGTEEIGATFRLWAAVSISAALMFTGVRAPEPQHVAELFLMLGTEFTLGYLIGAIPTFVLGGLAVAGQVIAGTIGLGQANMIDPSLGANVSVIARLQILVATAVFLMIDGHHVILRTAAGVPGELGLGLWRADAGVSELLVSQLVISFELALRVAAPILVTTLVTQFVLGLITKFVPQVNIFIISLPLSVLVGMYLLAYTFDGLARHSIVEFGRMEETIGRLYPALVDASQAATDSPSVP